MRSRGKIAKEEKRLKMSNIEKVIKKTEHQRPRQLKTEQQKSKQLKTEPHRFIAQVLQYCPSNPKIAR